MFIDGTVIIIIVMMMMNDDHHRHRQYDDHSVIRYYLVELVLMLIAGTDLEFILESQSSYHGYDKLSAPNKCEIEIIVISILIDGTHRAIDVI